MYSTTIVLADNDPQVRQTIVLAIQAVLTDALVLIVNDGETVIDLFINHRRKQNLAGRRLLTKRLGLPTTSRQCDLLLLDQSLPKLDGVRVLRQLRWLYSDDVSALPPIVFLANSGDDQLVAAAYRHGASGVLCKSVAPPLLADALQQTVRYWLATTVRPTRNSSPGPVRPAGPDSLFPLKPELASL